MVVKPQKISSKLVIIAALILTTVLVSGCSEQGAVVVFDVKHKPIFKQYSVFREIFRESGVKVVDSGVEDLERAKAYILAGPAHKVDEKEIVEFVREGGVLVVFIHIPPSNIKPILDEFGMKAETSPVEENIVTGVPIKSSVLTDDVERIILYGAFRVSHPIISEKRGEVRFSESERMGLVGFKKFEKGYVVIVGDDAAFTDQYIESADNMVFVRNLAEFVLSR
mgnify:CR=1 FL=1